MKANYEDKIPQATSEVNLGNLYDVNKQLMDKEPEINKETLKQAKADLKEWFKKNFKQKYFMLLCHELRDYTLFNLDKTHSWKEPSTTLCKEAAQDVIDCMTNRGTLLAVTLQDDDAWEIWVKNDMGCYAYYLFTYGAAVIEY